MALTLGREYLNQSPSQDLATTLRGITEVLKSLGSPAPYEGTADTALVFENIYAYWNGTQYDYYAPPIDGSDPTDISNYIPHALGSSSAGTTATVHRFYTLIRGTCNSDISGTGTFTMGNVVDLGYFDAHVAFGTAAGTAPSVHGTVTVTNQGVTASVDETVYAVFDASVGTNYSDQWRACSGANIHGLLRGLSSYSYNPSAATKLITNESYNHQWQTIAAILTSLPDYDGGAVQTLINDEGTIKWGSLEDLEEEDPPDPPPEEEPDPCEGFESCLTDALSNMDPEGELGGILGGIIGEIIIQILEGGGGGGDLVIDITQLIPGLNDWLGNQGEDIDVVEDIQSADLEMNGALKCEVNYESRSVRVLSTGGGGNRTADGSTVPVTDCEE